MTTSSTMESLETASLLYREPALYAEMTDSGAGAIAEVVLALADRFGPAEGCSALDVGCGTGAVLEQLACRYPTVVGVDLLPGMVELANQRRAALDVRAGDMRTVRLGRAFDLVVCVGNALSYLTRSDDVAAAFRTFAEHCVPGGLLVLQTITSSPVLDTPKTFSAVISGQRASATVTYSLEADGEVLAMTRRWEFDDGRETNDVIRRRVLSPDEQSVFAADAGFVLVGQEIDMPHGMTSFVRKKGVTV